jgi:dTDP-4-dehydrorhamnose reductase
LKILKSKKRLDFNGKIYNYSNLGFTNWSEFAREIIKISNLDCFINEIDSYLYEDSIKRPMFSITDKSKIISNFNLNIPHWKVSLRNYLNK